MSDQNDTPERSAWRCGGCRAPLGEVVLDPEQPYLLLETRQLTGRITLPVTRVCGQCGTANYVAVATRLPAARSA